MKHNYEIGSSKEALNRSLALKSIWSAESLLTQRILIYIAKLLEQGNQRKRPKKRKASQWSIHLGKCLHEGKTIQEASELWRQKKEAA